MYVRTYAFVRVCAQALTQAPVCLRYECSHAFGMRAGIRVSVCLFACACVRASVRVCMGMSVCLYWVHACIHVCIFKRP